MRHWNVARSGDAIVISCHGHDRDAQFTEAVEAFTQLMREARASVRVIADLTKMTGYEPSARRAWQGAFIPHRQRIRALILVGARSPGIRMGAAVVAAVAGIPVRFVADWAAIPSLDLH
jgi:hypothetical protein